MPSQLDLVVAKCETLVAQAQIAANQAAAAAASIGASGLAPLFSPVFTGNPTTPTPALSDVSQSIVNTSWIASTRGVPGGTATLDVNGLIPLAQLPFAGLVAQGTWSAATNSPHLVSGSGTNGFFYVVTVSGSTTLDGVSTWNVGDWALFGGGHWTRVQNVAPPVSNLPLSSLAGQANNTLVANVAGGTGLSSPTAIAISSITGKLSTFLGDSGSGGSVGLVPAPTVGMGGTAGYYLNASGQFTQIAGVNLSAYALLNSPAFTGNPTGPTVARNTNSTALATAQFVISQLAGAGEVGLITVDGTASAGSSTYGARIDHIHGSDLTRAPTFAPTFTGLMTVNGSVTISGALTLSAATLSVQSLTSAAFITAQSGTISQGLTINGTLTMGGAIVAGTIGGQQINLTHIFVSGSGALSGSVTAATQVPGNNTTLVANTAFVTAAIAAAIPSAIATPVQIITVTGTVTILGTKCYYELVGGGGGCGGLGGGPAGGASTCRGLLTGLTIGNNLNATVGAAGNTSGSNGGNSTLTSGSQTISTRTAGGGAGINSSSQGAGGTATGGDENLPGQAGIAAFFAGCCSTTGTYVQGGASTQGTGKMITGNITPGVGYGWGSAGASTSGGAGWIRLTWYP